MSSRPAVITADAALIAMGVAAEALVHACATTPPGVSAAKLEALMDERDELEEQILTMRATSPAGIATKLRVAYRYDTKGAEDMMDGPKDESKFSTRMLWAALKDAEAMIAAV